MHRKPATPEIQVLQILECVNPQQERCFLKIVITKMTTSRNEGLEGEGKRRFGPNVKV